MLDDFFIRAILGGIGVAVVAGPLGCFVIWRRLAYFGDTLSHSALLGVALAFLFELNITLTVFCISVVVALLLMLLQRRASLSSDALLGLLAHSALAVGLVVLAFMTWIRVDLLGFLFGDILATTKADLAMIWFGGLAVLITLIKIWQPLFAATVSYELAAAEGTRPNFTNIVFTVLLAAVIAVSMKIVGVLLITALLIIPAAAARRFSASPEQMALIAIIIGICSVWLGLWGSLEWDTPAGPSIVVAALVCFILSILPLPKFNIVEQHKSVKTERQNQKRRHHERQLPEDGWLTKNQSLVLDVLIKAGQPSGAYDLLDKLRQHGFKAPLQVYRALEQLIGLGLVHRLESLNAFIACSHMSCQTSAATAFVICDRCETVQEICDDSCLVFLPHCQKNKNESVQIKH